MTYNFLIVFSSIVTGTMGLIGGMILKKNHQKKSIGGTDIGQNAQWKTKKNGISRKK